MVGRFHRVLLKPELCVPVLSLGSGSAALPGVLWVALNERREAKVSACFLIYSLFELKPQITLVIFLLCEESKPFQLCENSLLLLGMKITSFFTSNLTQMLFSVFLSFVSHVQLYFSNIVIFLV